MKWTFVTGFGLSIAAASFAAVACIAAADEPDDASFKPLVEAPMPRGFPDYAPLGEIVVKEYPAYRMAKTGGGGTAFWTLFGHIKSNEIAMTAPVQMDYQLAGDEVKQQSMAFLYGNADMGEAGKSGRVEVVDVPAGKAVSIGMRGARTENRVAEAAERLRRWLAENPRYQADGDVRVMGYNSPFVPRSRNFWEVEIPLRDVKSP